MQRMQILTMNARLNAINTIADTYEITKIQAAKVYEGDANASIERGYYESS